MSDLEYQKTLADMTVPELIDNIAKMTEDYKNHLEMITQEILIRAMQEQSKTLASVEKTLAYN